MIRPLPPPSAWLQAKRAFCDVLRFADDELDDREFQLFVDYVCSLIAKEAARLARWDELT